MAICDEIIIDGHPNIYNGASRRLRIAYGIPEKTDLNTGIVLLVPGFGGNMDSNVYKKMRREFAEKLNMVVVQCEYFGDKFMQTPQNVQMDISNVIKDKEKNSFTEEEILDIFSKERYKIQALEKMNEGIEEFNDMGYMQTIDLLTTIACIEIILDENHIIYNKSKIIGYGHSHGAYLLYLANFLNNDLFSMIIDNSGWIFPQYLESNRIFIKSIGKTTLHIYYDYLAKKIMSKKDMYNLKEVYKNVENKAYICSYIGEDDELVNIQEKIDFINSLSNSNMNLIKNEDIDNKIFKSTTHSLGADLLKLFSYTIKKNNIFEHVNRQRKSNYHVSLDSLDLDINVNYDNGLPIFKFLNLGLDLN